MTVKYETGCTNIAINKEAIVDGFFILSTRLAEEIVQKFVNYGIRFAIYGDFFLPDASLAVDRLLACA